MKKKNSSKHEERGPLKLRKADDDQVCNLCLKPAPLSWDHVPPRACGNNVPVNVIGLFSALEKITRPAAHSNDGLRYRTVCVPCNKGLSVVDQAFGDLSKQLRSLIWGMTTLPNEVMVQLKPAAVLRSVLAHMLAAKRKTDSVVLDATIRSYLNGDSLDPKVRVYLWPYPFYETVIARDFVFIDHNNGYILDGIASVMKFFPLAFMVTDAKLAMPFDRLDQYSNSPLGMQIGFPINMRMVMDAAWPERPNRMRSVTGGTAFVDAVSSIEGHFGRRLFTAQPQTRDSDSTPDQNMLGPGQTNPNPDRS